MGIERPVAGTARQAAPGRNTAVVMVLGSCASLQVGAAFAAQLFPAVGSPGATALRLGIAAVLLLLWVRPRMARWTRRQWRVAALFGASLAGMNSAFYAAIERLPLGPAVTIEFLGPLTLAAVLTRRARDLLWVVLALVGVALLGFGGGESGPLDPVGVGFVLVAAAFWAAYILLGAKVGEALPGQAGLAGASVVAAVLVLPAGVVSGGTDLLDPHVLLVGLAVGVMSSVIPYSLELAALRRLPPRTFGILLSLEPAVASVAGFLLLAQRMGWPEMVAVALVVAASVGATTAGRGPREGRGLADGPAVPAPDA